MEMLLANKYPDESCEYRVIREHEMLHYQDLQMLFIRYQALVTSALRQAGFSTIERPIFVESVIVRTSQSKTRLLSTLQPIYASMERDLQEEPVHAMRRNNGSRVGASVRIDELLVSRNSL